MRKFLSILLFAAIVGCGAYYYSRHVEEFQLIYELSVWPILVLSIISLAQILFHGLQVKILTDHYELNLSFFQWLGLSRLTTLANLVLPPAGGASLKAVYLKRFHNLKYTSFLASTAIASIIRLVLVSVFAIILLFYSGGTAIDLVPVPGVVLICTLSFLLYGHRIPRSCIFYWEKLADLVKEWQSIRANHQVIRKLILLNCLLYAISSLGIYASFRAFSVNASLALSGVISALIILSNALKLIPANLGVKELVFVTIAGIYGISINEGLHAAALHRIIGAFFTLLLAPGFAYPMTKRTFGEPRFIAQQGSAEPSELSETK
jgi:uncharacterized membrane protein YbhN (UPF0104 family)